MELSSLKELTLGLMLERTGTQTSSKIPTTSIVDVFSNVVRQATTQASLFNQAQNILISEWESINVLDVSLLVVN
jgi:hypothetical protein